MERIEGLLESIGFSERKVAYKTETALNGQKAFMNTCTTQGIKKSWRLSLFVLATITCGACSPKPTVSVLQRGYLADYLMRPDRDKLAVKMNDHAFYSREASRGGRGAGGGGCGCN
jgi:hypothetical protein